MNYNVFRLQGRRQVFWVGDAGLHGRAQKKRLEVIPLKNQKLIGSRPLFLGKGSFHERNKSKAFFFLRIGSQLRVQLHSTAPPLAPSLLDYHQRIDGMRLLETEIGENSVFLASQLDFLFCIFAFFHCFDGAKFYRSLYGKAR